MREKTCFFIGHLWLPKDKSGSIFLRLDEEIEKLIQTGVTTFLSGGRLGFDKMAAALIADKKSRGYDIRLTMALPCPGHEASWPEGERIHFHQLLSKADDVKYISNYCGEDCVEQSEKYMAEQSAYCICAWFNEKESLEKMPASHKSLQIINVAK